MSWPAQQEKGLPDSARLCQLITAVGRSQDRAAFAELFVYFAPRIKAYLMKRGAGAAQAEELAQESMIMVWRRAATFDPAKSGAGTWIFTIARNKRIDALRRERRPDYDPEDPSLAPPPAVPPDSNLGMVQQSELLKVAIGNLPEAQAELVRMAYFEDKAHGQIAVETDLPLGTVKSRLRLALGRLRKAMAGGRP
ncbi:MAG: sigma-70 family RNA polymerase sigma factor [Kiloniellaceae bacterium]